MRLGLVSVDVYIVLLLKLALLSLSSHVSLVNQIDVVFIKDSTVWYFGVFSIVNCFSITVTLNGFIPLLR